MKYNYKKELINGLNRPIIRLQKEIETVSGFLNVEINDKEISEWYIEAIDNVLEDKSEFEERCGEICGLKINKDFTHVFEYLGDDGLGNNCYIETEELKNLIIVWSEELNKFREKEEFEYNKKLNEFIKKAIKSEKKFRNELLKLIEKVIVSKDEVEIKKDNYIITVYINTVHIKDSLIKDDTTNHFNIYPPNLKDIIIKANEQNEKGNDLIKF